MRIYKKDDGWSKWVVLKRKWGLKQIIRRSIPIYIENKKDVGKDEMLHDYDNVGRGALVWSWHWLKSWSWKLLGGLSNWFRLEDEDSMSLKSLDYSPQHPQHSSSKIFKEGSHNKSFNDDSAYDDVEKENG